MKKMKIVVLDEHELKYANLLEESGLSRSVARVIVCLMVRSNIAVREIAIATGMTSAAVNVAIRKLKGSNMVLIEDSETGKRADRRYQMVGDWKQILTMVEDEERKKVTGYLEKSGQVRKQLNNDYSNAIAKNH